MYNVTIQETNSSSRTFKLPLFLDNLRSECLPTLAANHRAPSSPLVLPIIHTASARCPRHPDYLIGLTSLAPIWTPRFSLTSQEGRHLLTSNMPSFHIQSPWRRRRLKIGPKE